MKVRMGSHTNYGLMRIYTKHRQTAPARVSVRQTTAGFTLIEILVAISIFAFMMTALYYAFNLLAKDAGTVDAGVTVYAQARICLDRLTSDLQSVYVAQAPAYEPPEFDDAPDPYRFLCDNLYDGAQLRFVAFSHLPLGSQLPVAVGRISYYLHKKTDGEAVLMRSDEMIHTEEDDAPSGMDPVVCEHVRSFSAECLDDEGVAHDYWDSDKKDVDYATPRAVKLVLVVGETDQADPSDQAGRTYRFETVVVLPVYRDKVGDV